MNVVLPTVPLVQRIPPRRPHILQHHQRIVLQVQPIAQRLRLTVQRHQLIPRLLRLTVQHLQRTVRPGNKSFQPTYDFYFRYFCVTNHYCSCFLVLRTLRHLRLTLLLPQHTHPRPPHTPRHLQHILQLLRLIVQLGT